ncbi:DUF2971 domain-containing protein [Vibrio diabolicus]|uniref:DUF2971 domain-containing protein n=1 Tax=Vibrio diabolicus TaxID=50719 RepID=UPI00215DD4F5|nr:DUF2971 domain-containing protein [Vibrio diabolicus]MCS0314009.1 DUF2971 domain-containing protein [Vibrio diabolicus]
MKKIDPEIELKTKYLKIKNNRTGKPISNKKKNIPTSLFKYRAINEYSLSNLENETLWLTSADKFNDPYDSSLYLSLNRNLRRLPLVETVISNDMHTKYEDFSELIDFEKQLKPHVRHLFKSHPPEEIRDIIIKLKTEVVSNFSYMRLIAKKEIESIGFKIIDRIEKDLLKACDMLYRQTYLINSTENVLDLIKSCDEISEKISSVFEEKIQEINYNYNKTAKQKYLICSLSEVNDSILMWSHYADNHAGFVMEYDFTETIDIREKLHKVIYDNNIYQATGLLESYLVFGISKPEIFLPPALYKSKAWEYEKEWRIVEISNGDNTSPYNKKVPKVKSIYLGVNVSPENEERIMQIASYKQIPVYKMITSQSEHMLKIKNQ